MLACLPYVKSRGVRAVPWRQSNLRAGGLLFIESETKSEPDSTRPLTEVKSKSPDGYSLGSTPLTFSGSAYIDDTSSSLRVHTVWLRQYPEIGVKEVILKDKHKFWRLKRYVGQIGSRKVPDPFFSRRCVFRWCHWVGMYQQLYKSWIHRRNLCNSPHHRLRLRTHKYSWEHYPKNTTSTCGEETAQSKHETEMSRWARNAGDTGQMEDSKNCYGLLGSTFPFGKPRNVCFGAWSYSFRENGESGDSKACTWF